MKYLRQTQNQAGYLMLLVIIMGAVFLAIVAAITNSAGSNLKAARTSLAGLSALSTAEAGADNAIFNLNKDNSYVGTNTSCPITTTGAHPVTFFSDNVKGKGTFETCVANGTIPNEKVVYATGKVYLPANASKPLATRRLRIILIGTYNGTYAVQTGPGGLIMTNSATITNGDVYVGGTITMSNTAAIGSAAKPLNIWAGDYVCPKPYTPAYPILCGVGSGDSIIINGPQAHIYGTVNANNQTSTSGLSNPGLVGSSGVADSVLPDYDRAAQKSAVTGAMTAAAASCSNNQTRTWPANTHITGGDVTLDNNCIVTVQGNVWIDGSLTLKSKAIIKVDGAVASTPTIMIDGSSGLTLGNQTNVSSNTAQIGIQFITFWANSACSPDCTNLTGTGLANSQNVTTMNINNQGLGAGSTLYARWSKVVINNSGSIYQVLGQTIELDNPGNITFGSSTTSGAVYTFAVRYYEQI